jgi:hypothetical protein
VGATLYSTANSPGVLLDLLVRLVLPAMPAEFLHFQALGSGLFVLGAGVIAVLALRALKSDDIARHAGSPT